MPTFPLFEPRDTPAANAWHRVTSPGGYEWWYFDAEHATQDIQIVAILFDGFVFHPGYLRADTRYRRRPTRILPPLPSQYPCAYFVIYESGKVLAQFMTQYAPTEFRASTVRADIFIGPNLLTTDPGGLRLSMSGTPWRLTASGPRHLEGSDLRAKLTFRPLFDHAPAERTFLSRRMTGAEHRWVIASPLCAVEGEVRLGQRIIPFAGRGYHDHNYGTGPLGPGLARWTWGRLLTSDHAVIFHAAEPRDPHAPLESHLISADATGLRDLESGPPAMTGRRLTSTLLTYPRRINLGAALELSRPRLVDSSPFYLRLQYDAHQHRHPAGRAFCEIACPHRLRWPILGRMIEMSIHRKDQ